jgi:hypothetical protein
MNLEDKNSYTIKNDEINTFLNKFKAAINSQYSIIDKNSSRIILNNKFEKNSVTTQTKHILDQTNHEMTILENESVVIFSTPLLLSKLICVGGLIGDKKSKTIRLISEHLSQKKFVSDYINTEHGNEYTINETVWGVILPTKAVFKEAKILDFKEFFSNEIRLNRVTKAQQELLLEIDRLKDTASHYKNEALEFIETKVEDYKIVKNDIKIAINERKRLEDSTGENKEILDRIQTDIDKENKLLDIIKREKNNLSETNNILDNQIKQNVNKMNKDKKDLDSLNAKATQQKEKINELDEQIVMMRKDINLTTLDMKGYSKESKKQLRMYFWLSLIAMAILTIIFFRIYDNAEAFVNFIDSSKQKIDAWNILVSRLPLITATALVIGTLSALLFYLVNHILSVNSDDMNMLKASILAEQITGSLETTGMTDDQIRDYKRNTKIELVMGVFTSKHEKIKNNSESEKIKQILESLISKK